MKENKYQAELKKRILNDFPGSIVLKNDPNMIQGIPDLLVLFKDKWAALEVKKDAKSPHRPNQEWYVTKMDAMSYAATIYPENEEMIMDELQRALQPSRKARIPKCK